MINPKNIIEKYTIKELSKTANDYFKNITDTFHLTSKPFGNLLETPELLRTWVICYLVCTCPRP